MSRIFVSLSALPVLLIFVTMAVGLWIGDYNGAYSQLKQRSIENASAAMSDADREDQDAANRTSMDQLHGRFNTHFQLGLASALTTVLINSLSVTYLIGTSRWVKEVCETYALDSRFIRESNSIKRTTFPWSIVGVCSILTIVVFGALADPGTLRESTAQWVSPHMYIAMIGATLIVIAIWVQAANLQRNAEIIQQVVDAVHSERSARGLPVD